MLYDAQGQPIPGTEKQSHPTAVPMAAEQWGMGFVVDPITGNLLSLRFSAAEGDLMVQDMTPPGGKHHVDHVLVRARPTDRGFLTLEDFDAWVALARSEFAAVEALAEADSVVEEAAEQIASEG